MLIPIEYINEKNPKLSDRYALNPYIENNNSLFSHINNDNISHMFEKKGKCLVLRPKRLTDSLGLIIFLIITGFIIYFIFFMLFMKLGTLLVPSAGEIRAYPDRLVINYSARKPLIFYRKDFSRLEFYYRMPKDRNQLTQSKPMYTICLKSPYEFLPLYHTTLDAAQTITLILNYYLQSPSHSIF